MRFYKEKIYKIQICDSTKKKYIKLKFAKFAILPKKYITFKFAKFVILQKKYKIQICEICDSTKKKKNTKFKFAILQKFFFTKFKFAILEKKIQGHRQGINTQPLAITNSTTNLYLAKVYVKVSPLATLLYYRTLGKKIYINLLKILVHMVRIRPN